MKQFSTGYIFIFAAALCLVCSTMISVTAVSLRDRQEVNQLLDRKKSVLLATRIIDAGDTVTADRVEELFSEIDSVVIDLDSGEEVAGYEVEEYDFESTPKVSAPTNQAQIQEIPEKAQVFQVMEGDEVDMLVLPIYGQGLWSTMYGYLALDSDTKTVRGITFYEHGETPGLGGEVDNPTWKNRWPGRKVYDEEWEPHIQVVKGQAGPPEEEPHKVDGLSGATITSRGVSHMINFWLDDRGFGPYLENFREEHGSI